jgi:tetratricopeptide (TPR) repeat protein
MDENISDSELYIKTGYEKFAAQDYEGAREEFSKVIELLPKHAISFYMRAKAYYEDYLFDWAIEDFTQAIELIHECTEMEEFSDCSGSCAMELDKILNAFISNINKNEILQSAYYMRSLAREWVGDFHGAMTDVNISIQMNHRNAKAFNQRGNLKSRLFAFESAINDFSKAIRIDPTLLDSYCNKAIATIFTQGWDSASTEWLRAGRIGNTNNYKNNRMYHFNKDEPDPPEDTMPY